MHACTPGSWGFQRMGSKSASGSVSNRGKDAAGSSSLRHEQESACSHSRTSSFDSLTEMAAEVCLTSMSLALDEHRRLQNPRWLPANWCVEEPVGDPDLNAGAGGSIPNRGREAGHALTIVSAEFAAQDGEEPAGASLGRSTCAPTLLYPMPDQVSELQGPWELIPGERLPDAWLRAFLISNRVWIASDGSDDWLRRCKTTGKVMLAGGTLDLEAEANVLVRTGRSGQKLRFRRFELPEGEAVEQLRGSWSLVEGRLLPAEEWLQTLSIDGVVWRSSRAHNCGILRRRSNDDGCSSVALKGCAIWVDDDGCLYLTGGVGHRSLRYLRKSGGSGEP